MAGLHVDLAIPVAVDKLFTYKVPPELEHLVRRGVRAVAPFGTRTVVGVVVGTSTASSVPGLKFITDIIDPEPYVPEDLLQLAEWMAGYYLTPLGRTIKTVLVRGSVRGGTRRAGREKKKAPPEVRAPEETPATGAAGPGMGGRSIVLNTAQSAALETITRAVEAGSPHTFLLHGVTGSGKTQVYIEAIRETLRRSRTAIVLVPEIALTPQTVRRFEHAFGEHVVALHSRMSQGERTAAWRNAREGKVSIAIGPRSALFAPLRNLGLIVVDEEHEPSYKQFDQSPRYHARDAAVVRAGSVNAVVVLGSATPSFESYANALSGKYTLLELPERADNARLPSIAIVDMTQERRAKLDAFREERKAEFRKDPVSARERRRSFTFSPISDLLREKIQDRIRKQEGIILLQNRRGFSPFVECPDCGHVEQCERCSISLTYHRANKHLRCHYCGFVREPPETCPSCRGVDLLYRGIGTQRAEEELNALFPGVRVLRMDLDTTTRKGAHDAMLRKFGEGEADILLGTQMVAKGLDFPRVTLVGVISADTQMLLPDFRSGERTFQLLSQVAGRAGRSTLPGEVVIQTFRPLHDSFIHVVHHDFMSFYRQETAFRRELDYPPYARVVLVELSGKLEQDVLSRAEEFREHLARRAPRATVLGPVPAAIPRVNGRYRWHILVKNPKSGDPSGRRLHAALAQGMAEHSASRRGAGEPVQLTIDVDPVGMM